MTLKQRLIIAIAASLLAGLFIGSYIGKQSSPKAQLPVDTSAEAGFARDMGDHHQQAVDMSFIIRDKSEDKAVQQLAFDIINTQATQRGMMMGWLQQWGLPQTTVRPALAWMNDGQSSNMDHGSKQSSGQHGGMMPGMASPEDIEKLKNLSGKEADILFMQLMIRHHEGGIAMAKGLLERSERGEVRRLSETIVNGQQAEIDLLKQMLRERDAAP